MCYGCKKQFSLKVGTIFEDSPLGLDKWMMAIWMIGACKNGVSSYEIHRSIRVTQKSAWFMLRRIRQIMHEDSTVKLTGEVEADETFIGGKARNMHVVKKARRITGTGTKEKVAVMGILERGGKVVTTVVPNRKKHALQAEVKKHVEAGSALYTDFLLSYEGLAGQYAHQVVDHAVEYVNGRIHTNGLENFWSLIKRNMHGTYVSVEPFYLFRYIGRADFSVQLPQEHGRPDPFRKDDGKRCGTTVDLFRTNRRRSRHVKLRIGKGVVSTNANPCWFLRFGRWLRSLFRYRLGCAKELRCQLVELL